MEKLGIYIHYPFCLSLCPYCDFNSFIKDNTPETILIDCYIKELNYYKNNIQERCISSVYFGGGTPSLMKPKSIEIILEYIFNNFKCDKFVEVTIEANPTSSNLSIFKDFKNAGINRVSIGVQALNDRDLSFLGRKHSFKDAVKTIEEASSIFDNFSFDLIYARHCNQSIKDWENELNFAISLARDHISLYSLTIESGTPFSRALKTGKIKPIDSFLSSNLYFKTLEIMSLNGFERYEVSNFTKNWSISMHNMLYWTLEDYIGIGPGSHGRVFYKNLERIQTETFKIVKKWIESVKTNICLKVEKKITKKEQIMEILLMGLRVINGINLIDLEKRLKIKIIEELNQESLKDLLSKKLISMDNQRLKTTKSGINFINMIVKKLIE